MLVVAAIPVPNLFVARTEITYRPATRGSRSTEVRGATTCALDPAQLTT